jgi:hypothetical protein
MTKSITDVTTVMLRSSPVFTASSLHRFEDPGLLDGFERAPSQPDGPDRGATGGHGAHHHAGGGHHRSQRVAQEQLAHGHDSDRNRIAEHEAGFRRGEQLAGGRDRLVARGLQGRNVRVHEVLQRRGGAVQAAKRLRERRGGNGWHAFAGQEV